jgi:hypothetical protein
VICSLGLWFCSRTLRDQASDGPLLLPLLRSGSDARHHETFSDQLVDGPADRPSRHALLSDQGGFGRQVSPRGNDPGGDLLAQSGGKSGVDRFDAHSDRPVWSGCTCMYSIDEHRPSTYSEVTCTDRIDRPRAGVGNPGIGAATGCPPAAWSPRPLAEGVHRECQPAARLVVRCAAKQYDRSCVARGDR